MSGVRTDASGNVILTANGVDAVKANVSGVITAGAQGVSGLDVATINQSFGQGQTWQDMTASRALGTTYTNSTGRSIQIGPQLAAGAGTIGNLLINGVVVNQLGSPQANSQLAGLYPIIPNGATYSIAQGAGTLSISKWWEYR